MFHKKTVEELLKGSGEEEKQKLARSFGTIELTALGVGAIIGTGIFVLTGVAAAKYAGPGVIISFMISGFVAALAALSYAELSAAIPAAGSSYAYTFASMGEFPAWLIGWSLILEYLLATVAVAVGWSAYFNDFLCDLNIILPKALTSSPFSGGMINLPAVLITIIIAGIAYRGAKDSAVTAKIVVGIKLAVVLLFIVVGVFKINSANWIPFTPFGFPGIVHGASIIFFAYLGFDAVSTAAEEVKNPQKDLPRGAIGSLCISSILYILVAGILTGMVSYTKLDTPSPLTTAMMDVGVRWAPLFISVGAIAGLTSVLLALVFAQSRIWMSMSRDGLLPKSFFKNSSQISNTVF
jgi:Amino acid transporters